MHFVFHIIGNMVPFEALSDADGPLCHFFGFVTFRFLSTVNIMSFSSHCCGLVLVAGKQHRLQSRARLKDI